MAKEDSPAPPPAPAAPSRLETLRARLKEVAPAVKVERVAAVADTATEPGSKAYVLASWGNKRVTDVAEGGRTLDETECRVLESVIANHKVS